MPSGHPGAPGAPWDARRAAAGSMCRLSSLASVFTIYYNSGLFFSHLPLPVSVVWSMLVALSTVLTHVAYYYLTVSLSSITHHPWY